MPEKRENRAGNPGNSVPGGGMAPAEKSRDLKLAYAKLMKYIGNYKQTIVIAAILSLLGALLNLVGPGQLSKITNMITAGLSDAIDIESITKIAVLLAVLYLLGFLFNYVQGYIMATVSQRVTQNMRRDIAAKIDRLALQYFDTHATGDILSRVTNDVDTVSQSMNQSFSTLVSSICLLFGSIN